MRKEETIEREIQKVRDEQRIANAPFENMIHALKQEFDAARDKRRGTLSKCHYCHCEIYRDKKNKRWRSIYNEGLCCIGSDAHDPKSMGERYPEFQEKLISAGLKDRNSEEFKTLKAEWDRIKMDGE